MIKYLLEIDSFIPAMYLKEYHTREIGDVLVSFTKNPDEAKKFLNEIFAKDFCGQMNSMQPLQFSVVDEQTAMDQTIYQSDNITSKSLSEDDMKQKAKFIETQLSEPHDIMICKDCNHFGNPEKCPQNIPTSVSCPAAESIEDKCDSKIE